jgi:hypothetical protein
MSERGTAPKTPDRPDSLSDGGPSAVPETAPLSGAEPTMAALSGGMSHVGPEQPSGERGRERADGPSASTPRNKPKPVTEWTGREVAGRYKVLERLGEGGMGVVYGAEHLSLKKKVAFKVIHPELAAHEDLMLRFQREALATGQLDHPHITAAIDFGDLPGGGAFMVMPWVRGHSLQHHLEQSGKMDFRRAATICAQIADALSAAHATGVVHRDLKPDNVLLETRNDGSEAAKVLDFGVASLAGRSEGQSMQARPLTQAGTILGTPGYMSPEQASAGDVDHRTDIYALGVILWELLRGERLFSGDDITQIFAKQFAAEPPSLELGLSSSARELSTLVTRMLAWDKSARPSTAAEVRDILRRIAVGPDTRLPSLRLPVSRFPQALQALPLPSKLEPYRGYVPLALVAMLLLVVVIVWSRGGSTETIAREPEVEAALAEKPGSVAPVESKRAEVVEAKTKSGDTIIEPVRPARVEATKSADQEMMDALDNLTNSRTANSRRTAAKWILKHEAEAPRYIALLADLELNTRCNDKKEVVEKMRDLSDPRVLPALDRLADTPRRGCGLIRLTDCYACLRRELDQTIGVLRHAQR